MEGGGFGLGVVVLLVDVEGLLKACDRRLNLALVGFENTQLMEGGGFILSVAKRFFDLKGCFVERFCLLNTSRMAANPAQLMQKTCLFAT
ncbi:MAG: hypothetical protein MJA27_11295 [Pseudanabaenales cyanobacterium]|nr:hypothetical protein [Pseudanabaenales cyanobacterium]